MNYCHLCQAARFGKRSGLEGGGRPKCRVDDWPLASCCSFEYCATELQFSRLSVSWGWRRNSNSVMGCRHESWHRMTTGAARLGLVALAVLSAANPSNKRLIWRCFCGSSHRDVTCAPQLEQYILRTLSTDSGVAPCNLGPLLSGSVGSQSP